MLSRRLLLLIIVVAISAASSLCLQAQESARRPPTASTSSVTQQREEQEPVKVFTEEVRLPVSVTDERGRFDPTLEKEDIVVVEDDVPQEVKSLRHVASGVLLLLDTGTQLTLAKDLNTTRQVALRLVSNLRSDDQVAVIQFGERAELLQDWTTNREAVEHALKTKLHSGRRTRLAEAMIFATNRLKQMPVGSRQVVLLTDGVESPDGRTSYESAVKQLTAAQATVHVISYTALTRQLVERRYPNPIIRSPGKNNPPQDITVAGDPTMPQPSPNRNPSYTLFKIDLDTKRRQQARDYANATLQSEQKLSSLAEESGGRILLPTSITEMINQGDEVAREIDAQYVLTYKPKRPLASAKPGEYRRINVALRRPALQVRSRRGYTVPTEEGKRP